MEPLTPARLRAMRLHYGWTQRVLAGRLAVTPNTVARWERGIVRMPAWPEKVLRRHLTVYDRAHGGVTC